MSLTMVLRSGTPNGYDLGYKYTLIDENYNFHVKSGEELKVELQENPDFVWNLGLNGVGELVGIHGSLSDYLMVGPRGGFVYPEYGRKLNIVVLNAVNELGKQTTYSCFMDNGTLKSLKETELKQYLKMNRVANMINGGERGSLPSLQGHFLQDGVKIPKEITNPFKIKVECFTRVFKGDLQVEYAWLIFQTETASDLTLIRKKMKDLNKELYSELKKLGASNAIFDNMKVKYHGNSGIAAVISFKALEQWRKLATELDVSDAYVSVIDYDDNYNDSKGKFRGTEHEVIYQGSETTFARLEEFFPYLLVF